MPIHSTLLRRLVTIPALLTVGSLSLMLSPCLLGCLLVWDRFCADGERKSYPRTRCLLLWLLYLICEWWGLGMALLLWLFTLGGHLGGPGFYLGAHYRLQRYWTAALFGGSCQILGMKLVVENSDLVGAEPFILWVRHTSLVDTLLASVVVANPKGIRLRYLVKRELLWDPCLDVVGQRLPNLFVDRSGQRSQQELKAVEALANGLGPREGVLIYPEGTRFTTKKLQEIQRAFVSESPQIRAAVANYRHVLPPRVGGPLRLLEGAPHCDVVVLAHVGLEGATTAGALWKGDLIGSTIRVELWKLPRHQIPAQDRVLWLHREWSRVDDWVGAAQS